MKEASSDNPLNECSFVSRTGADGRTTGNGMSGALELVVDRVAVPSIAGAERVLSGEKQRDPGSSERPKVRNREPAQEGPRE